MKFKLFDKHVSKLDKDECRTKEIIGNQLYEYYISTTSKINVFPILNLRTTQTQDGTRSVWIWNLYRAGIFEANTWVIRLSILYLNPSMFIVCSKLDVL